MESFSACPQLCLYLKVFSSSCFTVLIDIKVINSFRVRFWTAWETEFRFHSSCCYFPIFLGAIVESALFTNVCFCMFWYLCKEKWVTASLWIHSKTLSLFHWYVFFANNLLFFFSDAFSVEHGAKYCNNKSITHFAWNILAA